MFASAARDAGVTLCVQRVGSMLTPFFQSGPVLNWSDASASDTKAFGRFHSAALEHGVYWPPSQYEAGFVSAAHDARVMERTEQALRAAFKAVASQS
jgi:glutamate-1-semialdehyde 2,1-aminomutase